MVFEVRVDKMFEITDRMFAGVMLEENEDKTYKMESKLAFLEDRLTDCDLSTMKIMLDMLPKNVLTDEEEAYFFYPESEERKLGNEVIKDFFGCWIIHEVNGISGDKMRKQQKELHQAICYNQQEKNKYPLPTFLTKNINYLETEDYVTYINLLYSSCYIEKKDRIDFMKMVELKKNLSTFIERKQMEIINDFSKQPLQLLWEKVSGEQE